MTPATSPKIVGGLLVPELVDRILTGDKEVPGTGAGTYGLETGESVRRQASRAWPYLLETWQEYARRREARPDASGQAHRKWLNILLRELGFTRLETSGTVDLDGRTFPISHRFGSHVPVHLLGWGTSLDTRTARVTARAPHAMVQELLNRSDDHLWALLSNGQVLRILRDTATLTGQAYLEFDLQAIFGGEQFSDFTRMYLLCHASRFVPTEGNDLRSCYLEQWRGLGASQGERALKELRKGVELAITELGSGFLTHPDNPHLRSRLRNGELSIDDFNRALLRNVYRLLFWFVAEDRDVLLQPIPKDDEQAAQEIRAARERYGSYFSSSRLRQLARKRRGTHHSDLWEASWLILSSLGEESGIPELALPALGGIFETRLPDSMLPLPLDEPLDGARLSNRALLAAVRALAYKQSSIGAGIRQVDFGNLGAEELGSVYEGLLELKAHYNEETYEYTLETLAGNERKGSGSYYTPSSLVERLLDSTLDPLLDRACTAENPQERINALLDLTVCDPACGSGHFLVAAARRIAKRVAAEETGEPEPTDPAIRSALRKVVGRCIYGVDINPMAAELAKISLWMEALEPGKPLTYLDANIRVGNTLLGTTPKLLADGIPSAAFAAIEGDDSKVASALKKQNTEEIGRQGSVLATQGIPVSNTVLAKRARDIHAVVPDSLEDLHIQQRRRARDLEQSEELQRQRFLADAWCAAFVQPKTEQTRETAITQSVLEQLVADALFPDRPIIEQRVNVLSRQYRFFHWHIEYPHLFRTSDADADASPDVGWAGGFDCILGNPPWERVKLQEKEFFASRQKAIANAKNAAARKKLIAELAESDNPSDRRLDREWRDALRESAGTTHLLRTSGRYPKTGSGDINTYAVFAETSRTVLHPRGRAGLVLPTGIATDATTAPFFGDLVKTKSLVSLYDFENEDKLFADVDHRVRFCMFAICGQQVETKSIDLAFRARQVAQIEAKRFTLTPADIERLNPNTLTCPVFDDPRHAEIVTGIYRRVPVLWRESPESNPWQLSFQAMFHMSNDSGLFHTQEQLAADGWVLDGNVFIRSAGSSADVLEQAEPDGLFELGLPTQLSLSSGSGETERMLPLYEAKMIHHFDSRFSTYEGATQAQLNVGTLPRLTPEQHADSATLPIPRYWVAEGEVEARLQRRSWERSWLLGWRDICRSSDERTMIAGVIPRSAVGDKYLLAFSDREAWLLQANLTSFVLDYCTRQKFSGTSLKYFVFKQLPVVSPDRYKESISWLNGQQLKEWITSRVLELQYTANDLTEFAEDLGAGGPPFVWDEARRFAMRAELDAAYFHLYGVDRGDVIYILDSFRAFQNNDLDRFARTKQMILEVYDAMSEAAKTGKPYETPLDPPPGHGPRHVKAEA